ncbi:MAG: hypothetical protein ACD_41C00365G0012 [uncultured bacterium]|nr:MAG: hypothetical protein ACD_41C00365G0012 [uncultured bacterium]HBY73119.1 hypothetical protein [Candidatus Kerfeldbacteria bacterium]
MTSFQRLMTVSISAAVLCNAAIWLMIFWLVDRSVPTVILHYNIFFGPDGFGTWVDLLVLPVFGLVVIALNYGAASWLWQRDRFLTYVAASLALFVQTILITATALVIAVNRT